MDLDAERARLDDEIARIEKDLKGLNGKLGNAGFVAKAPPDVVAKFQEKLEAASSRLSALMSARSAL